MAWSAAIAQRGPQYDEGRWKALPETKPVGMPLARSQAFHCGGVWWERWSYFAQEGVKPEREVRANIAEGLSLTSTTNGSTNLRPRDRKTSSKFRLIEGETWGSLRCPTDLQS